MKRALIYISYLLLSLLGIGILASAVMLTANSAYAYPTVAGQNIDKSLPVKAGVSVLVRNIAGSVKILGWSKDEVHVSGALTDGTSLDFHPVGDGVEIRVIYPQNSYNHAQADLSISVPATSRLSVNTVSADIEAKNLTGSQKLESVSGAVKLDSQSADINAQSVSGEVDINGSAEGAHVSAHSVSGDVKISHAFGDLQAESVSGTVKVFNQSQLSWALPLPLVKCSSLPGPYSLVDCALGPKLLSMPPLKLEISKRASGVAGNEMKILPLTLLSV